MFRLDVQYFVTSCHLGLVSRDQVLWVSHIVFRALSELHKCNLYTTTTPATHSHTLKKKGEQFFLLRHLGLPIISTYNLSLPAG